MRFLSDGSVDEARAAILASGCGLAVNSIRLDHQGMDNFTFVVDDVWCVRFPRAAWCRVEAEKWTLNALQGKTTMPVPRIDFEGKDPDFSAYRRLAGVKVEEVWAQFSEEDRMVLADDLGRFLAEMHAALDPVDARAAGVRGSEEWEESIREIRAWMETPACRHEWKPFLDEVLGRVAIASQEKPFHRVVHQDLHGENVLADPNTLRTTAVIDFGDVGIEDYHVDLAITGWIDPSLVEPVCEAYRRYAKVPVDVRRAWDYYVAASASDTASGIFDCSVDLEREHGLWLAGKYEAR